MSHSQSLVHFALFTSLSVSSYNQTEEDFSTLREYNDYLEEVESIGKCVLEWVLSLSLSPSPHRST